jgi:DNA-damage-inducible protein D
MLSIYDHLDEIIEELHYSRIPLRHLASELLGEFGFDDEHMKDALDKAFELCMVMDIPITLHFRKVYVYEGEELKTDWMLSDLASYLVLVNGDIHNPNVAKARLYLLHRKSA